MMRMSIMRIGGRAWISIGYFNGAAWGAGARTKATASPMTAKIQA
jgi:hypothetical protein